MYTLEQLKSVNNQLVRFRYTPQTSVKEKRDLVQRKGTKSDQVQGKAGEAWVTNAGALVLPVRNQNQQVPGDRKMVSDTLVRIAMESQKKFHGMPGEFLPITCRAEGITNLEVMRGNKWVKVK
jgi:hypothetical protein